MTKRRVVVTGIGMVTPLGNDLQSSWQSAVAGKSGVAAYDCPENLSSMGTKIYAGIKNFDADLYLSSKEQRIYDTFIQYGYAAAKQALDDSGLVVDVDNSSRIGVLIGSGIGGLTTIEGSSLTLDKSGPRRISPFFIPGCIINMVAGLTSIKLGLKGLSFSTVSACTTGAHNIGEAARHIMYGDADVILAGGAEKASTGLGIAGFSALKALSTRNDSPEKASRPWDKDRDGFVLGDGAGVLVLEEYEHAKRRGAKVYAELTGYGLSSDAYHMTAPSIEGMINCMRNALKDAHISLEDVDYINAHGTSTPVGDPIESNAIKEVFGKHAYSLTVSSTKSMTGHLLGATGAVEAAFGVLAIQNNIIPPTINLDNPDDGCDLDYAANKSKEREVNVVVSNSFGFGGTNASLVFRKVD